MARWEPDARGRLRRAALDLYDERGFEETTVQDIADRAGVTERTFFRHFADKREVLFDGSGQLEEAIVSAVRASTADDALTMALDGVAGSAGFFDGRMEWATRRARIIDAHPALRERELLKLSTLSAAIAETLRGRDVSDAEASLVADVAVALFRGAFQRWIGGGGADFAACLRSTLDDFDVLARSSGVRSAE